MTDGTQTLKTSKYVQNMFVHIREMISQMLNSFRVVKSSKSVQNLLVHIREMITQMLNSFQLVKASYISFTCMITLNFNFAFFFIEKATLPWNSPLASYDLMKLHGV